jgi:DNA-binding NtrC family response regulator
MEKTITLVSTNEDGLDRTIAFLAKNNYRTHAIDSIVELNKSLARIESNCVILDLDAVCIDNRTIREMTLQYPHIYFLCMSSDRFHPELKDAICYHIYACLTKPLDYDELLYWLRCIEDNGNDPDQKNDE